MVHVGAQWLDRLAAPTPEETDLLADAPDAKENSRLSCQIIMSPDLDGLEVTLAASAKP
jgi:2Fe-2S ferredoxin